MIERTDRGGVAILRLKHGKASALDIELLEELRRQLAEIAASDVRALVVTGTGSIFSAGVDLPRLLKEGKAYVERFFPLMIDAFSDLFLFPRPVVSAVNGHAIAGGAIINASADYRIMAAGEGRVGVPELRVGVPFPALALEIVRFGVPSQFLQEHVYRGGRLTPDEALSRGIIDEIADANAIVDRAVEVANDIGSRPRDAFRIVKRQIRMPYVDRARQLADADREALAIWSAPATHEHIRTYLDQTIGRK
jgi:enoyl-CoA hydratase